MRANISLERLADLGLDRTPISCSDRTNDNSGPAAARRREANILAVASPIPLLAPVIAATLLSIATTLSVSTRPSADGVEFTQHF